MNPLLAENLHGHNGIVKYPRFHWLKHRVKRLFRPTIGKSSVPYDWSNPTPIPSLVIKNQYSAGSCGGEASSYGAEVLTGTPMSAKSVYSRGYAPGGGMTLDSVETIAQDSISLESDVPSYNVLGTTDEAWMENTAWITPELLTKGQTNALGTPFNVAMDVESIAEATRDYKWVFFLLQGQNGNGWLEYVPTPPSRDNTNPIWGHYLAGIGAIMFQGVKGIIVANSWGTSVGQEGLQFITQPYIDSGYIIDCVAFEPKAQQVEIQKLETQVWILTQLIAAWKKFRALLGLKNNHMNNQVGKFGILSSSVDPNQLGATVSGAIVGASVFIIWIAQTYLHLTLTSDAVSNSAEQIGTIVSALWTSYGLIRKFVVWMQSQWPTTPTV